MIEAEHVSETQFPIDAFPEKVQSILLEWHRKDNYLIEFAAASMLSAVSSALGGTYQVHIKSDWYSNGVLYMILVGRPGLGKTPPLKAAFSPIQSHDYERYKHFKAEMEALQASDKKEDNKSLKPVLARTIVSDFTPEALMQAHNNNPRGITILVDEIMGMFNSANRYSNGQLIEQLLTAWSGGAIDVTRVNNPIPIRIEQPCINMIGTTQTKRIHELLKKGYEENGLLDRIVFVLPVSQKIPNWIALDERSCAPGQISKAAQQWQCVLNKIIALDYVTDEISGERHPTYLDMNKEARDYYYNWWNEIVNRMNAKEDDAHGESRVMKQVTIVARLALLFQVLRYACGESHLQHLDVESIKSAFG